MAVYNICGFETGGNQEIINLGAGTWSVQSTTKRTGGYALRVNPATTGTGWIEIGAQYNISSGHINSADCYFRFYFRVDTLPGSASEECFAIHNTSAAKIFFRITSAGNFQAYASDGTTQLGSDGATTLATDGTWYRIEIFCGTGTPANYELKIGGAIELSGSTNLGGNNARLSLGKRNNRNGQSVDFYYDDVMINTTAYPGSGEIKLLNVDSDGTYTAWTVFGAGAGADWEQVEEIPINAADGLQSTLVIGDASTVGFETCASAGVSGTINAIKQGCSMQRETSGASMKLRFRSGGSDFDSAAFGPGSSPALAMTIYETDPATSAAWTISGLNAVESGGVENTNVGLDSSRMWSILLMVDYNPVVPRSYGTIIG